MKSNSNSFRILLITFEPAGEEHAFEVHIKFVAKGARARKAPNVPPQPGRRNPRRFNGRGGDSAL